MKISKTMKIRGLDEDHLRSINGGGFWVIVAAGITIAAAAEIISDWDNFRNGLQDKPEE
jgi:hypothetical protein